MIEDEDMLPYEKRCHLIAEPEEVPHQFCLKCLFLEVFIWSVYFALFHVPWRHVLQAGYFEQGMVLFWSIIFTAMLTSDPDTMRDSPSYVWYGRVHLLTFFLGLYSAMDWGLSKL